MDNLSEEKIKDFWKRCGFKSTKHEIYSDDSTDDGWDEIDGWQYPDSTTTNARLPDINLNNLFKYAIPKCAEHLEFTIELFRGHGYWACNLFYLDNEIHKTGYTSPELALLWAIYEILEKNNKEIK